MSQQHRAQLQEAYQLIKSGNKQDATRLLLAVLKEDRDNADAWWLLANATTDTDKQRQALNQVLRLKPDHNAAQRLLEKVNTSAPMRSAGPPPAPSRDPFAASGSDDFGDPFGASSTQTTRAVPPDDPFNAPTRMTNDPFGSSRNDDPFGDPFAAPPSRSQNAPYGDPFGSSRNDDPFASSRNDDPFADPFAVPPSNKRKNDDPYTQPRRPINDDPFMSGSAQPPVQTRVVVEKKRTNPFVILLAIIGIVVVIGCGLTVIAGAWGFNFVSQAVQTAMPDGTFEAYIEAVQTGVPQGTLEAMMSEVQGSLLTAMPSGDLNGVLGSLPGAVLTAVPAGTLEAIMGQMPPEVMTAIALGTPVQADNGVIGDIVEKGAIGFTSPIRAQLEDGGFTNHAYKFTGEAGQTIAIELNAIDNAFDVKLALLSADGSLVAENDDIDFQNNNLNSRIEITLPANGSYTVVVGDVGFNGGEYELRLMQVNG
jgi:hypothetical protein